MTSTKNPFFLTQIQSNQILRRTKFLAAAFSDQTIPLPSIKLFIWQQLFPSNPSSTFQPISYLRIQSSPSLDSVGDSQSSMNPLLLLACPPLWLSLCSDSLFGTSLYLRFPLLGFFSYF